VESREETAARAFAGGRFVAATDEVPMADVILREAAVLFKEKGYLGATTRELGDAVGIRGASVYYHFKTKEDILYGICLESLRRLTERVLVAAADVEDPLTRLRLLVESHVVNILEDRHMHATMLTEVRYLSPERLRDVTERRDAYEAIMYDSIGAAQRAGDIRADMTPRQLPPAILSLLNWTIFWYRPDGELATAQLANLLADVFLGGALTRA
jgi:TetR/AcrR family transcriptional regulator, cholesterol catabolism regulator